MTGGIKMKKYHITHFVRMEHLNHHGLLYAGCIAEWLIECGYLAATGTYGSTDGMVFLKLNDMTFKKSAFKGNIVHVESWIADLGTTSIKTYVKATNELTGDLLVDAFMSFICVDENKKSKPHGLTMPTIIDKEMLQINRRVKALA